MTANGIKQYQEWPAFRHTFSHFHLDIYPIYAQVGSLAETADEDCSPWKKVPKKTEEYQSDLLSAVKYWYDPQHPEPIGLATPVKNLLTQYVRNHYGKNGVL